VLDPFCGSGTTLVAATLLGRKSIGIDTSADAINVTKDRLANPVKTSSELLRRGRNSYLQQEDNILHWLHGIDVVPVQRNRGIDAVLKAPPSRQPVLFRIQRPSESLLEAAISLHRAGAAKQPATLILIATNIANNGSLFETFPSGVIIVNSTATEIMSNVLNNRVRA
jgi:site-specific DNA-methyltransferase (adenine-specific)